MPFTKLSNGKYKSPSGKIFTAAQARLYYANNQSFPKRKKKNSKKSKTRR